MKSSPIYISYILLILLPYYSNAQYPVDYKCHLSEHTVHNLYEDNKGFIWAISSNTLNRYDGDSWESILPAQKQSEILNDIRDVTQDNNDNYWFALGKDGIRLYMVNKNTIINSDSYNGSSYYASGVFPTLDYRVFVATPNGLLKLEEKGVINKLKSNYTKDAQSTERGITSVINDYERTTVWMSGANAIPIMNLFPGLLRKITKKNYGIK